MKKVAILIFDKVEVLDFAGPFEVFSVSYDANQNKLYDVCLIAETADIVKARGNFLVQPNKTIDTNEKFDIVLIPGGYGTRPLMNNETIKKWIQKQFTQVELMLSVCTGSLVLGKAGLLENISATTHHLALSELEAAAPNTKVIADTKYVDNGKIITSAGISAGIEMALHVVAKEHGMEQAQQTASYMEYDWNP
jgi:transcriptional regulator GlxA family with amidase domain